MACRTNPPRPAAAGAAEAGAEIRSAAPRNSPPPAPVLTGRDWLFLFALIAAVFVVYQPAWHAGFIWDDDAHVTPANLRSWHGLWRIWSDVGAVQQYYPLLHTTSWLEYPLFGDNPAGYHLFNIGVHALNAVLLWFVLRRLQLPGAPLAAAVFALHPVMVESVAWITELKNTQSGLFYLAAVLAYLRFDADRNKRWYATALGLFVCALLSKTTAATLPAALLVVGWWQRGRLSWRRDWFPLLPFFAVGAADGLFVAWVEWNVVGAQGADFAFTFIERSLIAGHALWFYLGKIAWPVDLIFIYPRWNVSQAGAGQYFFPLTAAAGLVVLWLVRQRSRAPLAAALFFVVTLLPVLGFLNVYLFVFSFVADHLQYMAAIGVIVAAAAGGAGLVRALGAPVACGMAVAVLVALGALTWRQSRMYRDAETLYRQTLDRNPNAWLAHANLGGLLVKSGAFPEALAHLTAARAAHPEKIEVSYNLALALLGLDRTAEAIPLLDQLVRANPNDVESLSHLGDALLQQSQIESAIGCYERAVRLQPDLSAVQNNLGNALLATGRMDEGIAHLEQVLRLNPDDAEAHFNLGLVLAHTGRLAEAIRHDEAVVRLRPNDAAAHLNLAAAQLQTGHAREAVAHFEAALRLDPKMTEAREGLDEAQREAAR